MKFSHCVSVYHVEQLYLLVQTVVRQDKPFSRNTCVADNRQTDRQNRVPKARP